MLDNIAKGACVLIEIIYCCKSLVRLHITHTSSWQVWQIVRINTLQGLHKHSVPKQQVNIMGGVISLSVR